MKIKQTFGDYINMLSRGVDNLPAVIQATVNQVKDSWGLLPLEQKEEAERRFSICSDCPFNSFNAQEKGFYENTRTDFHCSVCGCTIDRKVMAFDESCGLSTLIPLTYADGRKVVHGWKLKWEVFK